MKVGITGQSGFVGRHLTNFLSLQPNIEIVPFQKNFFEQKNDLVAFVGKCDVIVHLAGMNRHHDSDVIYQTNISLSEKLILALKECNSAAHVIFSSSTQEEKDNVYGNSKRVAREKIEEWANENQGFATGLVIPNVFGPFGKPLYNSVIATFCHQLTHGENPTIIQDGALKLIYVNKLVAEIYNVITNKIVGKIDIPHQYEFKVSEILEKLKGYVESYLNNGVFPNIDSPFGLDLFNTFRCYVPKEKYPFAFKKNVDERGTFVEIVRANSSGQFSFSTTKPGITRGNHFHTRKAERFAVIKGKASIKIRKIDEDEVKEYIIDGEQPAFVDMPIWHTHNITNIGTEELITLFWINEPYNPEDPDTYFVNV